jgi:site-specific recombinase
MAAFGIRSKHVPEEDPTIRLSVPVSEGREEALRFLRALIGHVRPASDRPGEAEGRLRGFIERMDADPALADSLRQAIRTCLHEADLLPLLTESGLTVSRSLGRELSNRIKHKLLPRLRDENDFLVVIDTVFHDPEDFRWVELVPSGLWGEFLSRLTIDAEGAGHWIGSQLLRSLDILSVHVAHLGCEPEVAGFLPDPRPMVTNPFMLQQESIRALHRPEEGPGPDGRRERSDRAKASIRLCRITIGRIRSNMQERGASLAQTFILYQMDRHLERMSIILDIIDGDGRIDMERLSDYFVQVVRNQNRKYSIREFLSQTTGYLAYQIAEQKGRRGHSYITRTKSEYRDMLFSAMKGGLIVCFVALFKNLLSLLRMAPFWQGLAYSLNYSAGFLLIDRTGSTLATKQPAYTANSVAGSIQKGRGGTDAMQGLVETVVSVSRSQFASFLGNLVVVFPGTYLLAWALDMLFGFRIAEGEAAMKLIMDQHPTRSLSLLYACNTGAGETGKDRLFLGQERGIRRRQRGAGFLPRHGGSAGPFLRHPLRHPAHHHLGRQCVDRSVRHRPYQPPLARPGHGIHGDPRNRLPELPGELLPLLLRSHEVAGSQAPALEGVHAQSPQPDPPKPVGFRPAAAKG